MAAKVLSSDKARAKWREVLDTAVAGQDIVVERYGQPTVAIIAYKDFVQLAEALQDLRDLREAEAALVEWQQNPEQFEAWEDVKVGLFTSVADE